MRISTVVGACALNFLLSQLTWASQVIIGASKDNTLYEDETGSVSNGNGVHCFAGRVAPSGGGTMRRAVFAFDVQSAIPVGSTINAVTLRLNMSRTISGEESATLYRLLADWGEGTSDANANEGIGATSTPGDATWLHTFYPSTLWGSAGGDFAAGPSASITVGDVGPYTWGSTAEMVADVQEWQDHPENNFGWILIGNEATITTAKRFDTREMTVAANRPQLVVDFTPPPTIPAASTIGIAFLGFSVLVVGVILIRRRNVVVTF